MLVEVQGARESTASPSLAPAEAGSVTADPGLAKILKCDSFAVAVSALE